MRSEGEPRPGDGNRLVLGVEEEHEGLPILAELVARDAAGQHLEGAALRAANALGKGAERSGVSSV